MSTRDTKQDPLATADDVEQETVLDLSNTERVDRDISEAELTAADIYPCEPEEVESECTEEEICPDCIPDENYPTHMIPNWKRRIRPFLNPKTCHYCVTVWSDYTLNDWQEIIEGEQTEGYQSDISEEELFEHWMQTVVLENSVVPGLATLIKHYNKDLNWAGPTEPCDQEQANAAGATQTPVEKSCDRFGGGISESADAYDDSTIMATVGASKVGKTYYDINGVALAEELTQGQVSESWTGGRYFWDEEKYKEDGGSFPYGWIAEREFFYISDDSSTRRLIEPGDVKDNGTSGAFLGDTNSDDFALNPVITMIANGQEIEYKETTGLDTTYSRTSIVDYCVGLLDSYVPRDENPLRIDLRGHFYIYDQENDTYIPIPGETSSAYGVLLSVGMAIKYFKAHGRIDENQTWSDEEDTALKLLLMGILGSSYSAEVDYAWDTWADFVDIVISSDDESTEIVADLQATTIVDELSASRFGLGEEEGAESAWISDEDQEFGQEGPRARQSGPSESVENISNEEAWIMDVEASACAQYLLENELVKPAQWYVPPVADTRIKVQICIPARILDMIPEPQTDEDQPYSVESEYEVSVTLPNEVEFTTEELADGMFDRVTWLIGHYADKRLPGDYVEGQVCVLETFEDTGIESVDAAAAAVGPYTASSLLEDIDNYDKSVSDARLNAWNDYISELNDGPPNYKKILTPSDLKISGKDNLRKFEKNLIKFLDDNIDGYHGFSWHNEHNKRTGIENIKIQFTTKFQIKTVTYNLRGCPPIMLTGQEHYKKLLEEREEDPDYIWNPFVNPEFKIAKGWGDFAYTYPQSDPRTMAYVASLPYMDSAAQATVPMEWQDFITLWTWPKVKIGNFNELRDNSPPCNSVSDMLEGAMETGWDVFVETLTRKFDQNLCKTFEEGSEAWETYFARYKQDPNLSAEELENMGNWDKFKSKPFAKEIGEQASKAWRDIRVDDPFMQTMWNSIDLITDADGLWTHILHQLGRCGLLNFIQTMFQCMFSGVEFGDILERALQSALKNMEMQLFQRLLVGLPPWVQNDIAQIASQGLDENIKDWRPWDNEPSGDYAQRNEEEIKIAALQHASDKANKELQEKAESGGAEAEGILTADGAGYTENYNYITNGTGPAVVAAREAAIAASEAATEQMEDSVSQWYGVQDARHSKTLGSILVDSGAVEAVKEAYIDALMQVLTPSEILDTIENIPGMVFLKDLFDLSRCPGVSMFHPPLKGWFNDLQKAISEWDIGLIIWCTKGLYIPRLVLDRPFLIWDWLRAMFQLLLEALEAAIVKALIAIMKMILEWILDLLCKLMGTLGAAAMTAVGLMESSEFQDFMRESLCGVNATDEELESAMGAMLSALGATPASTEQELRTAGAEFVAYTGDYVSKHQVYDMLSLLHGSANNDQAARAADFYSRSGASFASRLGNTAAVKSLFGSMGQIFIGQKSVENLIDAYGEKTKCMIAGPNAVDSDVPFCSLDPGRAAIQEAYKNLNINLPQNVIDEMSEASMADFDNAVTTMLNLGTSGGDPMSVFPSGSLDPCSPPHPGSIIPKDNAATLAEAQDDAEEEVGYLQQIYEEELIGGGGFFDRILSDKDGRGKMTHDRKLDDLLEKAIGGNPTHIASYLRDIMRGERTSIATGYGDSRDRDIDSSDSKTGDGGTITFLEFSPVAKVGYGVLDGGWNNSLPNSLEIYDGKEAYCWAYGASWTSEYKSGQDFIDEGIVDEIDQVVESEDGTLCGWKIIKYPVPSSEDQPPPTFPSGSEFRKYCHKPSSAKLHIYPEPSARLEYKSTDPGLGRSSKNNAGYPAYHFHFWNEERNGMDEQGVNWNTKENELEVDTAKLHIFELIPTDGGGGIPSALEANGAGEQVKMDRKGRSSEYVGNIESHFRGYGPNFNAGSDKGNSAIDPIIRTVRPLDEEILEHIKDLEISVATNEMQKPTIWATYIAKVLGSALDESNAVPSAAHESARAALEDFPLFEEFYGNEYDKLCNDFMTQYAKQITDDENLWKSGLVNFELKQLTEDECIDLGLSKYKGDDEDKKEIADKRSGGYTAGISTGNWNITDPGYSDNNNYKYKGTGWYRPEPIESDMGLSEQVDLPAEEYGIAAYYIHQQYQRGWARMADEYLPGPANPCEEQISSDIFNWQGVIDHKMKAYRYVDDDPRVGANPQCVWDPPYDRVNTRDAKATMESLIKATMRVTIFENLIKGIPAFSKFNPSTGCFGDLLPAYLFKHMRQSIFNFSRRVKIFGGLGSLMDIEDRYDYAFLEQCCNMYVRGVAAGDFDLNTAMKTAIDAIDKQVERVYHQPSNDWFRCKRRAARRKVLQDTEADATIVAKELFKREFEESSKRFANWTCSQVDNLQEQFLTSGLDLDGASTTAFITDVAKNLNQDRLRSGGEFSGDFEYLKNGGFVIEKYIRIKEKSSPSEKIERHSQLYGVVNLEEWSDWLSENDNFEYTAETEDEETGELIESEYKTKIGEEWISWSYGLRLCYVPSFYDKDIILGITDQIKESVAREHKAFKVEQTADKEGLSDDPDQVITDMGSYVPLIPIVSTEIEIPPEMPIGNFNIVEDYDFDCLMKQLMKQADFRTLFEYVFALDRFLAVPTIYMLHCFLDSIGLDDDWYQNANPSDAGSGPGDPRKYSSGFARWMRSMQHSRGPGVKAGDWLLFTRQLKKFSGYRNWEHKNYTKDMSGTSPFFETRESLRDLFMGEYHYRTQVSGNWKFPKFKINFNFGQFGFDPPRWFMNRMLEGPDCEEEPGSRAAAAAFNRM